MGLIAIAEEKRISSLSFTSGHEIRCKYPLGSLTCPWCGGVVFPRDRMDFLLHFVHKTECTATIEHHPESLEHLLGKEFLAKRLSSELQQTPLIKDCSIEIEYPVFSAGKHGRVADVAAIYPSGYLLIYECQLSPITTNELEQRTHDYKTAGGDTVWFFGLESATSQVTDWAIAHQGFVDVFDFTKGRY